MIAGRIVAVLSVVILAAAAVQAVLHALVPVMPLLIILGIAVTAAYTVSRYRDRW